MNGFSKSALRNTTSTHLIDPQVELDIPFATVFHQNTKPDAALTNVLEILERIIVRSVRCHRPHPNRATQHTITIVRVFRVDLHW